MATKPTTAVPTSMPWDEGLKICLKRISVLETLVDELKTRLHQVEGNVEDIEKRMDDEENNPAEASIHQKLDEILYLIKDQK